MNTIVSTDLDGTLLDHFTYSWQAAKPSIDVLKAMNVPIIINTSKTFAEVEQLQKELSLDAPFIVENGSAIYFPKDYCGSENISIYNDKFDYQILGSTRSEILDVLRHLAEEFEYEFEGFSDWDTDTVIKHTGLNERSAELSQLREYSEPILWSDSEERFGHFSEQVKNKGMRIIRGGRFIHILGQANKGSAVSALASVLFNGEKYTLISLGDSYNDLDMLNVANYPVFVRSPAHDFPEHQCQNAPVYTELFGPEGWHEAMSKILKIIK